MDQRLKCKTQIIKLTAENIKKNDSCNWPGKGSFTYDQNSGNKSKHRQVRLHQTKKASAQQRK